MTPLNESDAVQELLDKAAIAKLIHTVARAMDARDWDQLTTCFVPEAVGDFPNAVVDSRDAIVAGMKGLLEPLNATQHLVANINVSVEGDTATAHATFMAQHVRAAADGNGHYIMGGDYDDNFRRTDDGWKFTRRQIRGIWSDGDPSVMAIPVS
ncbi:nuclear transport factor 2 family protein [Streptomyces sp. B21-083]|uniref:nuclear transport factor 2 family protein n=1 Tax=Streptomyces sp. B21-083 TaxID=3039410 RepID=UPI002FF277DE